MDVARLARRMGSESTIISAVPREEMNCYPDEFDDAIEEGAKVEYLTGTLEILRNKNGIRGVKCAVGGKWPSFISGFKELAERTEKPMIRGVMDQLEYSYKTKMGDGKWKMNVLSGIKPRKGMGLSIFRSRTPFWKRKFF